MAQALDELTVKQLVYRVRTLVDGGRARVRLRPRARPRSRLRRSCRGWRGRRKHAAVAGWIEEKAGDRAEDLAEILAHHYATAVDLARAAGETELADSLLESAIAYLTSGRQARPRGRCRSGRTLLLPCPRSRRRKRRRTTGTPVRLGQGTLPDEAASGVCGRLGEGDRRPAGGGELRRAAVEMCELGVALETLGETRSDELVESALDLLAGDDPSPELVRVLEKTSPGLTSPEKLTPRSHRSRRSCRCDVVPAGTSRAGVRPQLPRSGAHGPGRSRRHR